MKALIGTITSLSAEQTARVSVERRWRHPLYKKSVKRSKNYACHNLIDNLKVGDSVRIVACRPISKTKHFKVMEKVQV
ncbi:MAG TPA: 30S ribosomal protein S17 [Candidatus Woesebacteria bacterium]|nr:30S ribosomal protein S17 [Candidatus Woesebacteria bacterium]